MQDSIRLAERMSMLGTESAFDVLVRARALEAQGRHVIHLQLGEPDFDTPEHIVEAGVQALRSGETHYTPAAGIPPLREAIAREISKTRGIVVGADQVVVTPGGKPIMFFAILALAGPGDEVIYPDPGFPIYESVINFAGATPVPLKLREEQGFSFAPEELTALVTDRTRLVIINSPHNPTGGVVSGEALDELARLAVEKSFIVMSDEIYSRILYEGHHESITTRPGMLERTIILDGFSKTFAMTGWRLGFGVMPEALAQQVTRLAINCNSCVPAFTQLAGVAALTGPQQPVERMVAEFRSRRDAIVAGLNDIPGVTCLTPPGAFYVFPNVSSFGQPAAAIADRLLNEGGVALVAGTAFGKAGEGYLRLSYANSLENIEMALERMREVLA
ncbi:MAG TPA: pyridoxal phosphate-dependent aminotransferase [Thermomicrobiales bacterium]|nr:pyridoxal phosphate-dependent aminotransferase [Thermomicrobiales bacterium]